MSIINHDIDIFDASNKVKNDLRDIIEPLAEKFECDNNV
jgi:hypothetical protein